MLWSKPWYSGRLFIKYIHESKIIECFHILILKEQKKGRKPPKTASPFPLQSAFTAAYPHQSLWRVHLENLTSSYHGCNPDTLGSFHSCEALPGLWATATSSLGNPQSVLTNECKIAGGIYPLVICQGQWVLSIFREVHLFILSEISIVFLTL